MKGEMIMASITRRNFARTSTILAGGAALCGGAATALASEPQAVTYADTIAWDGTYDVVVIGFGLAGAVAARCAADAGAQVLLCDAAPEGQEGGNSRFCGQKFFYGSDRTLLEEYIDSLNWQLKIDPDMRELWIDSVNHMDDFLREYLDIEPTFQSSEVYHGISMVPEYPEFPGASTVQFLSWDTDTTFGAGLFTLSRNQVAERADRISIWLGSPAKHLIQDPQTKAVIGAVIERDGRELNVRALNGVCLTCGGFECNTQMIQDYLGTPRMAFLGGAYNNGDGIKMALEVGADLWHMTAYESNSSAPLPDPGEGKRANIALVLDFTGACIVVAEDGSRYINESEAPGRHGHAWAPGNVYRNPVQGWRPYMVFDQAKYDEYQEAGVLDWDDVANNLVSANTLEELADVCGMNPETLAKTVENFNFFCEQGEDYELRRDPATMAPFGDGPFYAVLCVPAVLNTQGGPRRDVNAQVLDTFGNPIPHLYSAGELGGICSFQYQGGGNLAEAMVFGKIAGENAAAPKDDNLPLDIEVKVSSTDYDPGKNGDSIEVEQVS